MLEDTDFAGMVLVAVFIKPLYEALKAHRYPRAVGVVGALILARVLLEYVRLGDEFSLHYQLVFQTLVNGGSLFLVSILFIAHERWSAREKDP